MANPSMTPPVNASGTFTVASPFTLTANAVYTCKAIRSFQDLIADGVDVKAAYYTPHGLTDEQYQDDVTADANIITLMSASQATLYIPDTYITSFPDMTNVAYSTIVLTVSLGPVPDSLDMTAAEQAISDAVSDLIGVTPTVTAFAVPSATVVTQADAETAETARQAAITNRTTDHAALLALQTQYTALLQKYQALEAVVVAAGLAS